VSDSGIPREEIRHTRAVQNWLAEAKPRPPSVNPTAAAAP
jgi:rubrerythrin